MLQTLQAPGEPAVQQTAEKPQEAIRLHLRRLARRLRRARAALDMAADAVLIFVPPSLRFVEVNQAACASLGYGQRELLGMRLADVAPQAAEGPLAAAIERIAGKQLHCAAIVTVHRRKSGAEFLVEASVRRVDEKPGPALVMVARPVCDGAHLDRCVPSAAFRDELTGLATRAWLDSCLEIAIGRTREGNYRFAVFFVDIDHFKKVNDRWGHLAGDEILRTVARRLTSGVHSTDLVARYGGDEFVVLMGGIGNEHEAIQVARRISHLMKITATRGAHLPDGQPITVTASIGVAISSNRCGNANELIGRADRAMYRAKAMGRDGRWVLDGVAEAID